MKKIKLFAAVAMVAMVIFACKKDKNNTETPGKATIEAKTVVDTLIVGKPNNPSEIGSKLYFSKNGKVTQLGGLFATKGNFRVSFWDFNTQNLIITVTINVTDTTKFTYVNLMAPIAVTANTKYVISMNNNQDGTSKNVYASFKKPNALPIYPFTTGSVTYVTSLGVDAANPTFPVNALDASIFVGIADLVFEPQQ